MRKTIASLVGLLALASSMSVATAEARTDADAKVTYEIPAGFEATAPGKMVMVREPKDEIAFFLVRTDENDLDKALGELDKVVGPYIKDIKMEGKPSTATYNGMRAFQLKGKGTFQTKPVNVTLRLLQTPKNKMFVVAGVYLTDKKEQLMDVFNRFYNSVKPAP